MTPTPNPPQPEALSELAKAFSSEAIAVAEAVMQLNYPKTPALDNIAGIADRHFAPLHQQLADVTKERDDVRNIASDLNDENLQNKLKLAQSERELAVEKELRSNLSNSAEWLDKEHFRMKHELATAQQAQRDTSARAGMAEELAGAAQRFTNRWKMVERGVAESVELIGLGHELDSTLARYAALPKGRL